jgi:hypothetical protein
LAFAFDDRISDINTSGAPRALSRAAHRFDALPPALAEPQPGQWMGDPVQARAWRDGGACGRFRFLSALVIRERQADGATVVRRFHNTRMIDA